MCDTKSLFTTTNTAIENFILSLDLSCYAIPGPQGQVSLSGKSVFSASGCTRGQTFPETSPNSGMYIIPNSFLATPLIPGNYNIITTGVTPNLNATLLISNSNVVTLSLPGQSPVANFPCLVLSFFTFV